MSWTAADIPDLTGKTAVVTGANSGLGLESAKALAGAGAHVIMATRNQEKAQAAFDEIKAVDPDASLEIIELDLASQASTKAAAASIVEQHPTVDILINNAGLMAMPERRTEDGFEMQLGVNHLGHWTFTAGLLPSLLAADSARVVTVTSTAHHTGRAVDPDNVNMDGNYSAWGAYGRAKLANYHFALGLQHEFERRGLAAQSLEQAGVAVALVHGTVGGQEVHELVPLDVFDPDALGLLDDDVQRVVVVGAVVVLDLDQFPGLHGHLLRWSRVWIAGRVRDPAAVPKITSAAF